MPRRIEEADKALFDSIADSYVAKDLTPYCRIARSLRLTRSLRHLARPIGRLLEVGCGAGFSAEYLAGDYGRYVGVDYSEKLIAYARARHASSAAEFVCRDIKDLDDTDTFDVVLLIGVLHHIQDVPAALEQMKQRLRPGGVIVANEPQRGNPLISVLRRIRKRTDANYSDDQVAFSAAEIERIFADCGFDTRIFPQGLLTTPLAETRFLPSIVGFPLSLICRWLDPALETVLSVTGLRRLAWNVVILARVRDDG